MERPNMKYGMNTEQYDVSYEDYINFAKTFGYFSEDGESYVVTDRNTPRQWMNFMVNDRFASVAGNDGSCMAVLDGFYQRVTKYYSATDYLLRTMNGYRTVKLTDLETGQEYDLLKDCENLKFTAKPGFSIYEGSMGDVSFVIELFVPNKDSCEVWTMRLKGADKKYRLEVAEDFALMNVRYMDKKDYSVYDGNIRTSICDGRVIALSENESLRNAIYAVFGMKNAQARAEQYMEKDARGKEFHFTRITLSREILLTKKEQEVLVVCGADFDGEKAESLYDKYMKPVNVEKERKSVCDKWRKIIDENYCELPDKNLQNFLNVWLKNQIYLTERYNRFEIFGYRDVMQDTWGHLLVNPSDIRPTVLDALAHMYEDGRCPRQFNRYEDDLDERDFMDSPLWIPITICDYIKETGDFSILKEQVGYYHSNKKDTVLDHILLSLDYLYHSRGRNGLILMRRGDWLDGLGGICQYGEATSVWGTIAAFHVQNMLAELFHVIGDAQTEEMMRTRSAEYKKIVNEVAWDGNWYVYAFIDEEPIGSSKCHEGKIYLNPQSWAIMSGIYDDDTKLEKMYRSIATYLSTPYGPQLNAPAYTAYGDKCGRLQKQRPGTFANGGIYLHATSFMVMAHCACGKYNDALDLIQRILPNHRDNNDSRRTSEPYCVGNVYYGSEHPCHGMNLYSWFSATPSWLIHDGFEGILGVKADYKGLKIVPRQIEDWEEYSLKKVFRDTTYMIHFKKGTKKGIFVDGVKAEDNVIYSQNKECQVMVVL